MHNLFIYLSDIIIRNFNNVLERFRPETFGSAYFYFDGKFLLNRTIYMGYGIGKCAQIRNIAVTG